MTKPVGPNVKRLIIARMALLAIPVGSGGRSLELGVNALVTPGKPAALYRQAKEWAKATIAALRAEDDCPWTTDEEVAADILKTLKKRGLI